jgi:hypothetical protein
MVQSLEGTGKQMGQRRSCADDEREAACPALKEAPDQPEEPGQGQSEGDERSKPAEDEGLDDPSAALRPGIERNRGAPRAAGPGERDAPSRRGETVRADGGLYLAALRRMSSICFP